MTLSDQQFANMWGIPLYSDVYAIDRYTSIYSLAVDIMGALELASMGPIHRTKQYRKAAALLIGTGALLDAFQSDPYAWRKIKVSRLPPRVGSIESAVREGGGPLADVLSKVVTFAKALENGWPTAENLKDAVDEMEARDLISEYEATLARLAK